MESRESKSTARPPWNKGKIVGQKHDKCQSDVQAQSILVIEMTNPPSDSLTPNGDRLIGHHL